MKNRSASDVKGCRQSYVLNVAKHDFSPTFGRRRPRPPVQSLTLHRSRTSRTRLSSRAFLPVQADTLAPKRQMSPDAISLWSDCEACRMSGRGLRPLAPSANALLLAVNPTSGVRANVIFRLRSRQTRHGSRRSCASSARHSGVLAHQPVDFDGLAQINFKPSALMTCAANVRHREQNREEARCRSGRLHSGQGGLRCATRQSLAAQVAGYRTAVHDEPSAALP
ncbi:hypothetical protein ACVWWO_001434 [Bradyrhizobium sp. F1.13.1]